MAEEQYEIETDADGKKRVVWHDDFGHMLQDNDVVEAARSEFPGIPMECMAMVDVFDDENIEQIGTALMMAKEVVIEETDYDKWMWRATNLNEAVSREGVEMPVARTIDGKTVEYMWFHMDVPVDEIDDVITRHFSDVPRKELKMSGTETIYGLWIERRTK